MYYTAKQIIEQSKRAKGFTNVPKDYWWVAIRSNEVDRSVNEFCCVFNLMRGKEIVKTTTCTTVPGLPALKGGFKRYNSKGAGVVCADIWMYDTFQNGLHSSRVKALRMVKPVWSTRDGNYNNVAEEYGNRTWGNILANVHPATFNIWSKLKRFFIGHWSYACIVLNNTPEAKEIIETTEDQDFVTGIILNEFSV